MLRTERLLLRDWREEDLPLCAAITADPHVMRYFAHTRDRARSDAWVARVQAHFADHGFGIWAVEAPDVSPFVGFVGLSEVPPEVPCAPAVEIAWTLGAAYWGKGYASEAARAVLADGFGRLGLPEIVALTTRQNTPSQAVMRRIGMEYDPDADFEHPRVPAGHPLRPHVLFRIRPA